ncbi:MAG: hypothetical protein ABIQ06_06230 [Caldimonas sp.]
MRKLILLTSACGLLLSLSAHAGGVYKFSVTCSNKALVAQWNTGDIDPGREFLRVSTGTNYPNCSVTDFQPGRDDRKPVEVYSGAPAVVQGVPVLGAILDSIFDF